MKIKKTIISFIAIACIAVVAAVAFSTNTYRSIGEQYRDLENDKIIALINDVPIYESVVMRSLALRTEMVKENAILINEMDISQDHKEELLADNVLPSKEDILNENIERQLLLQAAKEYGIAATEEEVNEYLEEYDKVLREADPEQLKPALARIEAFNAGMGISDEEYDIWHRNVIWEAITLGKLRAQISEEEIGEFKEKSIIIIEN